MKLTEQDVKKIKAEKGIGYAVSFGLVFAALFFTVLYLLIVSVPDYYLLSYIVLGLLFISLIAYFSINSKYNKDLLYAERIIIPAMVKRKYMKESYHNGEEIIYISVLDEAISALLEDHEYDVEEKDFKYFLTISLSEYEVSKELYEKIEPGNTVDVYAAKYSRTILGVCDNK